MTREGKIKRLKALKARCERLIVCSDRGPEEWRKDAEALDLAIAALRGPTREMVERMFRGCEVCKDAKYVTGSVSAVSPYDDQHETETYAEGDFDFCPNCGRPLTDEAVDMMLERLEEIINEPC